MVEGEHISQAAAGAVSGGGAVAEITVGELVAALSHMRQDVPVCLDTGPPLARELIAYAMDTDERTGASRVIVTLGAW
jgi:hypothetical protein